MGRRAARFRFPHDERLSVRPPARAASARGGYCNGVLDSPLSTLCRGCGLCCDGSLFTHVALEPDEVERLRAMGIPTRTQRSGTDVLPQRCSALNGRDCRIYGERPSSCAQYQCLLAEALVEERITLEAAQQVVRKAQRLVAEGHARRFLRQRFRGRKGLD